MRQASQPASGLQPELPAALRPLLGECWAIFNLLRQHTIKPMDGSVPRPMPPPATGSGGEAPAADDAADGRDTDGSGAAKGGRSGSGGGVSAAGASPSSCSSAPPPSSPLPSAGEPCTAPLAPPSSSSADADGQRRQLSDQGTAGAVGAQRSLTTPSSSSSSSSVVVDKHADSGGGGGVVGRHHGHGDGHHDRGGTHSFQADPRNADVLVGIRNGVHGSFELVWRPVAAVSVLDSGFMLGDGVWEGIRLHRGTLMFIDEHLDRRVQQMCCLHANWTCGTFTRTFNAWHAVNNIHCPMGRRAW